MKPNSDQSRCTRCITRHKTQELFPSIFANPNPNLTPNPDPTPRPLQDKVQVTRDLDNNALRGTVQLLLTLLRNKTLQCTSRELAQPTCPIEGKKMGVGLARETKRGVVVGGGAERKRKRVTEKENGRRGGGGEEGRKRACENKNESLRCPGHQDPHPDQ